MENFLDILNNKNSKNNSNSLLDEIFKITIKKGFDVRSQKLNGLVEWNIFKNNYTEMLNEKLNLENYGWKINWKIENLIETDPIKIYEYFLILLQIKDENDTQDPFWEQNHFFIQLIRIVKNNNFCLMRLLQIAYNIGQFKAEFSWYDIKVQEFFIENNLESIRAYI